MGLHPACRTTWAGAVDGEAVTLLLERIAKLHEDAAPGSVPPASTLDPTSWLALAQEMILLSRSKGLDVAADVADAAALAPARTTEVAAWSGAASDAFAPAVIFAASADIAVLPMITIIDEETGAKI